MPPYLPVGVPQSPPHLVVPGKRLLLCSIWLSVQTYTTPVSYSQQDDQVTIFTHANWFV